MDYSPHAVLLSLRLFSLTCWIKLSFVRAFIIIKSLSLSYYYFPYCSSTFTKTPAFLTLPCFPIPVFSGIFMKPLGMKKNLWGQQKHKSKGGKGQGEATDRDMLDPTGRLVSPSFSVQLGPPMLRVRIISETHWE